MKPCIICVAITGSVSTKSHNPAVPISVSEQVESTQAAFEAGASICHAHVRNDDQTPSSDPDKFAALKAGLEQHCPGMIIQFSTGGRSGAGKERGGMLPLRPDMASLTVGSNNFPNRIYENSPELVDWLAAEMRTYTVLPEIEAFDLSHIFQAASMHNDGRLPGQPYVQFVMGVKNAMPVDKDVFDFYIKTTKRLLPNAQWCAAGLEDNVRLDRDTLAPSNAALVKRVVDLCTKYERRIANPIEARNMLGLESNHANNI